MSSAPSDQQPTATYSKTYDVIIALHSFTNVPIADLNTLSADPYLILKLKVPTSPHDTPSIRFRTPTYHRNRSPLFDPDCFWRISNIPSTGFSLKIKAYDEDPMNSDDGLGSRKIQFSALEKGWKRENVEVDLKRLHNGSLRAFGCAGLLSKLSGGNGKGGKGNMVQHKGRKSGRPVVCMSIYVVGETEGTGRKGECWTAGPCYFTKHFSPFVGRVTGIVAPPDLPSDDEGKQKEPKYNFQANELQLPGPVPPELNHAFVPSKWLIKAWFKGILLPHVLHNHHRRIFSHDNLTVYGVIVPDADRKLLPEKLEKKLSENPSTSADDTKKSDVDNNDSKNKQKQKDNDEKGRVDESSAAAEIAEERRHIDDQKILENDENADTDPSRPIRDAGKSPPFKKATAPLNIAERFLEMCGTIDEEKSVMEKQHHKKRRPQKGLNERRHHCCRKCGQVKDSRIKKAINSRNNRLASSSSTKKSHSDSYNEKDEKMEEKEGEEEGGGQLKKTSAGKQRFIGQGCLFTYVLLLDGKLRWSEVGMGFMKEFGSKHVILANGSKHVAMAGEFLIQNLPGGKGFKLVIDNDSGTYRPPKEVLKTFRKFLEGVFGEGLEVEVLHCWGEEGERLSRLKKEHLKGREKAEEEEEEEEDEKENEEEQEEDGEGDDSDCDDCKSKGSDGDDEEGNEEGGDKEKRDQSNEDGGIISKDRRE